MTRTNAGPASLAGILMIWATTASAADAGTHSPGRSEYAAPKTDTPLTIDGIADERVWEAAEWRSIEYRWLGPAYSASDFQGRYKLAWSEDKLYVLSEIVDDVLIDTHRDPLQRYWDDDCLEVFIDEDRSGGNHQFNHNAFAYHMSLDNQTVDIGTDKQARNYSHHVESRWRQSGDKIVWELAIDVYADDYTDGSADNEPLVLTAGKILGFMIAYCDNDGSELRENFIGSESVPEGPKDRGWIDAGLFGSLVLVE